MATLNKNFKKFSGRYLFAEVGKRVRDFQAKNPGAEVMRLGVGDTTEPLSPAVIRGMRQAVDRLASAKTYQGYGDSEGNFALRSALAAYYKKRNVSLSPQEIFLSDGAKPDCANIQSIFGSDNTVAVSDPVYPVYVDASVIAGKTGGFQKGKSAGKYEGLVYMECNEKNGFVPTPPKQKIDLIYLCNPNNPTGSAATKKQLKVFVDYAMKNKSIIIYDATYAEYISDKSLPKTIYEIPGAKKCAIEINSFSKWCGFTGVRLGWNIVPMDLAVEGKESIKGKVNALWRRRITTMSSGPSNIAQAGGLAVTTPAGQRESKKLIAYYMENAKIMKNALAQQGFEVFGGEHAPYIWWKTPKKNGERLTSWELFDQLLRQAHVVGTPGVGFGPQGEGYMRLSTFGKRENIKKALESIEKNLKI